MVIKNPEKVRYTNPEGSATWEYVSVISCSSLIFCFGCIFGWTVPALADLTGPNATIACTDSEISMIVGSSGPGFGLSPLFTILMADKFGRKNSLLAVTVPMILHWGLIVVAKDAKVLSIARFLAGFSAGLGLCIVPMYLGEIASAKLRGTLGMVIGTMTNTGILCMFTFMPHFSLNMAGVVCLSISTLSMISIWFISESPYFLAIVGKAEKAEGALEKLRGKIDVTEEMNLIKRTISYEEKQEEQELEAPTKTNAFKQLMTVTGNRNGFFITLLFGSALQLGGYIISMVYGHIIFAAMKSSISASLCTTIIAVIQLVFNILTAFVIDRIGRRPLICISGVVSGVCVLIIGVYFYLMEHMNIDVTPYSIIPVGSMFVNIAAINMGLMPLQMVIQSEILATEIKALVSCLTGVYNGVITTIACGFYMEITTTWGFGHSVPFLGFFFVTWTCTAFILKILPETKGKTLLEIQKDLNA